MQAIILLLIAMVSIQSGASIAKNLFPVMGAAGTSALRLFFASLILWIIYRPWKSWPSREQYKKLAVYGISLGLMNLLFYFAIERIPLGIAVALEFTGPLAVAIGTSKKKIDFLWAILAGIGIYLLIPVSGSSSGLDILGIVFAVGAGAFWAAYILYGQVAGNSINGGLAATWGMTFAALVVIPFGFIFTGTKLFTPAYLPMGIVVAILSSAIPYTLEMVALRKLPTKTFGILMSLEPAVGAMAGLLILNERLNMLQSSAILMVVIASLGSTLSVKKNHLVD